MNAGDFDLVVVPLALALKHSHCGTNKAIERDHDASLL
jgi:hypothetical protein